MSELLAGLNPHQREAVTAPDGPLLILAGAGSGKTRTLTQRVAWLIRERGVAPWEILAVTFTNKAAAEMKQRLERLLGTADLPWVSTFHAGCVRILRQEAERIGFRRDFTIVDDQDQQRLLKDCLAELGLTEKSLNPRAAAGFIDAAKNRGLWPEEVERDDFQAEQLTRIYALYQRRLRQMGGMDFGDLLLYVTRLLEENDAARRHWAGRFRHVLVDEFQDTNSVQYRLTRALVSVHGNLCVVGDDDQSIYRWRGAEVGNILGFERDFPDCTVIRLEQNYRSTRTILEAANEVVGRNPDRTGKRLWTENPQGEPIRLETLADDLEESRYIADTIVELHRQGRPLRDMAVFYRTNAQSRSLEEAMVARRLPYAVFGGVKFFARMEVKDILAYLRLLVNPADSLSAKRIVNVPTRGIGKTTVERIDAHSDAAGGFYPACRLVLERGELSGAAAKRVAEFVALIEGFRERLATVDYPELTKQVIDETGYGAVLQAERTEEARDRLHNLQELVNGMEEHRGREATLADYLEQVALVTDLDSYDPSLDRVILMTLHAAKGLEFPVVFIAGMEDGLFPGARALPGSEELAEERRLCYVGMTRAMQRLYLSHARRRRIYGSYQYNPPSPFLAEIPPQLLANAPPVAAAPHNLASAFEAAPRTAGDGGHNLAAVFSQPPAETGEEAFEEPVRLVPEAEEGLRLGMKVRHAKFGVGVVRRIEGAGENTKVTIFFNTVGPKKLLLRFAGLEPA